MTYKLAKELKEAGFPQEAEYFWVKVFNNYEKWAYEMVIKDGLTGREYYAIPTLSELIEACGENIKSIRLFCNFRLKEYGVQEELQGLDDVEWYKTPEEAVAKLWLKLNE